MSLPNEDEIALVYTRTDLDGIVGRPLTDDEFYTIKEALPWSSIPDAIETVATSTIEHMKERA